MVTSVLKMFVKRQGFDSNAMLLVCLAWIIVLLGTRFCYRF